MRNKLTNLVIRKVALVPEGSCSAADILIYKRKPEGGVTMTFDEIIKSLPEDQQAIVKAKLAEEAGKLPEGALSAEEATKMKSEHEEALKKAKTPAGTETPEDILKGANLDPAVRALVEQSIAKSKAAEVAILKMQEEQTNNEMVAKSASLKNIPEATEKVLPFLKSIAGVEGAVSAAMEILGAADTLISKGAAFKEVGSTGNEGAGVNSGKAWEAIEKAANGLVSKSTTGLTQAAAISMVMSQQPELYTAYLTALRNEE